MIEPQVTLARSSVRLTGGALDAAAPATIRFHPAPPDAGLVFVRADLPGAPELPCRPDYVTDQPRWTSLAAGSVVVHHTEHVLAAVTGLGLDNLRIELGSDRVPVLGAGSARPFVDALRQAGLQPQSVPREVFRLREGMLLEAPLDAGRSGQPHDARSRVVVCVPSHSFGARYVYQAVQGGRELVGLAEYDGALESFGPLADARSYYLEAEREQIQKLLNPLLGGYIELGARSPQQDVTEVARHKLIDFLGDLAVLGRSVRARFAAFRSGHALHHELVRRLAGSGLLERERLA